MRIHYIILIIEYNHVYINVTRALRIYKKLYKLQNVLAPFTLTDYKFNDQNVMDLISRQTDCDKSLFNMNIAEMKWDEYWLNCVRGCIKYILHEPGKPNIETWRRFDTNLLFLLLLLLFK